MAATQSETTTELKTALAGAVARIRECTAIAIVLPEALALDVLGSAVALAGGLRHLGKSVSVFGPPRLPASRAMSWQTIDEDSEPLREFIISFDLARSPIKELKYERDSNRLNIILSPTGARIRREDVEFRSGPLRYELVITVGVPAIEAAAASMARAPELLYEKPILNLDANPANARYGELDVVPPAGDNAATLPELTYELLEALSALPRGTEEATALFAALAHATRNFRSRRATAATFRIAGDLLERGADRGPYLLAPVLQPPLPVAKLASRAIVRSRFDAGAQTLWSLLTKEDFATTGTDASSLSAVLEDVMVTLPYARRAILLWQRPDDLAVEAWTAGGEDAENEGLVASGAFVRRENELASERSYPSFEAAEAAISQLLRSPDAVE
mgnify:CR=1 FL=1